jgi:superfamily I DNA and/or RNA helicase
MNLQALKIRNALGPENRDITVDSVERFQGSERRVIIMTLTRSDKLGFLREETVSKNKF